MDHSGERAVEELLWPTQASLWPACCGRGTLGYPGITLGSVLWKSYFGLVRHHFGQCAVEELLWLLRDHFGQCAVEEVLWATQDDFGQCAVEELSWATQGSLWPVCCGKSYFAS